MTMLGQPALGLPVESGPPATISPRTARLTLAGIHRMVLFFLEAGVVQTLLSCCLLLHPPPLCHSVWTTKAGVMIIYKATCKICQCPFIILLN